MRAVLLCTYAAAAVLAVALLPEVKAVAVPDGLEALFQKYDTEKQRHNGSPGNQANGDEAEADKPHYYKLGDYQKKKPGENNVQAEDIGEPPSTEAEKENLLFSDIGEPPSEKSEKPQEGLAEGEILLGDMVLNKAQVESIRRLENEEEGADIQAWTLNQDQLWPGATVPTIIDWSLPQHMANEVLAAIDDYHSFTCIKFVPWNGERDHVIFRLGNTCQSHIGRQGGAQYIDLSQNCYDKTNAIHEAMHALGRFHEHQRPDRDNFISVAWQNVIGGHNNGNFHVLHPGTVDTCGVPYDLRSIMHYPYWAHSVNGQPFTRKIPAFRYRPLEHSHPEAPSALWIFSTSTLCMGAILGESNYMRYS